MMTEEQIRKMIAQMEETKHLSEDYRNGVLNALHMVLYVK